MAKREERRGKKRGEERGKNKMIEDEDGRERRMKKRDEKIKRGIDRRKR